MKEDHGNTGNKNAAKPEEEKATSFLHVTVTPKQKASYVKAAKAEGLKLAAWVKSNLDNAAES